MLGYLFGNALVFVLGGYLMSRHGDQPRAVGESVLAAGITGLLFLVYQGLSDDQQDRLGHLRESGLEGLYSERGTDLVRNGYKPAMQKAKETIDILAFGLGSFVEDNHDVSSWFTGNANIRILLSDPDFPTPESSFSRRRDLEERGTPPSGSDGAERRLGRSSEDARDFIRYLRDARGDPERETWPPEHEPAAPRDDDHPNEWRRALWTSTNGRTLEVRLSRCIPTVTVFLIDDVIFWSPYLIERRSRHLPIFQVRRGLGPVLGAGEPFLANEIHQHFDAVWHRWCGPLPDEWLT